VDTLTYFHIELENHEIIFAENCPAESFMGEEFRNLFHNAKEYVELYPNQAAPSRACLPTLEGGSQLQSLLRRLQARAGLPATANRAPGPLRGYIDAVVSGRISGWAQDEAAPEDPVILEILCRGRIAGRAVANHHRADLAAAGLGSGCHGFTLHLPPGLTGALEVKRAADGQSLVLAETVQVKAA
jgi:hypothetical protein